MVIKIVKNKGFHANEDCWELKSPAFSPRIIDTLDTQAFGLIHKLLIYFGLIWWSNLLKTMVLFNSLVFMPMILARIEISAFSPRIIGTGDTQAKFVSYTNKILFAKLHAFFHIEDFMPWNHPKPPH